MFDFIVYINGNISQIMPKSIERGACSGRINPMMFPQAQDTLSLFSEPDFCYFTYPASNTVNYTLISNASLVGKSLE
jgi:hypothetical protein